MLTPLLPRHEAHKHEHPTEAERPTAELKKDSPYGEPFDDLFRQAAARWGGALLAAASSHQRHAIFDVTMSHAQRLFKVLVGSDCEHMSLDAFRKGLEAEHFQVEESGSQDGSLLQAVFEAVAGEDGVLSVLDFHTALRRLKLCTLLKMSHGHSRQVLGCSLDWSAEHVCSELVTSEGLHEHLLRHRCHDSTMRWCHYSNPDEKTLLSLGALHQLHLRALDFYNSEFGETNVWLRGEDYNMLVPLLRLTEASRSMLRKCRAQRRSTSVENARMVVELERAQLYLFMSGRGEKVVTTLSAWRTASVTRPLSQRPSARRGRRHHRQADDRSALAEHRDGEDAPRHAHYAAAEDAPRHTHYASAQTSAQLDMFDGVLRELGRDYSELRTGDATLLTCRILGAILKGHAEVHEAYNVRLQWFEDHVDRHSDVDLKQMKRELGSQVRGLEAFAQLAGRVCDCPCFEPEVQMYVVSLRDKITQLSRDVGEAIELCGALLDEVKAQEDQKDARAGSNISLMVALLLPLQFLTGVYGMNFQDTEGQGVVPLLGKLSADNSYYMFWGLGLLLTVLLAAWFHHVGLLSQD